MKKTNQKKSDVVSAFMLFSNFFSDLQKEVEALGGVLAQIYNLFTDKEKIKQIAKIIVGEAKAFFSGNDYLKPISGDNEIVIDDCDGTELLSEASDTFASIDSDFDNYGANEGGEATKATKVKVYELIKDSNFSNLFASIRVPLGKMIFTQAQIKRFVIKHKHWLKAGGYATLFMFKSGRKYFVSRVSFSSDGKLKVYISQIRADIVWSAEYGHRLVLPQLELEL